MLTINQVIHSLHCILTRSAHKMGEPVIYSGLVEWGGIFISIFIGYINFNRLSGWITSPTLLSQNKIKPSFINLTDPFVRCRACKNGLIWCVYLERVFNWICYRDTRSENVNVNYREELLCWVSVYCGSGLTSQWRIDAVLRLHVTNLSPDSMPALYLFSYFPARLFSPFAALREMKSLFLFILIFMSKTYNHCCFQDGGLYSE